MNTTTSTALPGAPAARHPLTDWLFALVVMAVAGWAWQAHGAAMDGYEKAILAGAVPSLIDRKSVV